MGNLLGNISQGNYSKFNGFSSSVLATVTEEAAQSAGLTWDGDDLMTRTMAANGGSFDGVFRRHTNFTNTVAASFTSSAGFITGYDENKGISWDGSNLISTDADPEVAGRWYIKRHVGFTSSLLSTTTLNVGNNKGVSYDNRTGNLVIAGSYVTELSGFTATSINTFYAPFDGSQPWDAEREFDADFTYVAETISSTHRFKKFVGLTSSVSASFNTASQYTGVSTDGRFVPYPPTTPTNLAPTGDLYTLDPTPDLSWQHNDPNGEAQSARTIELETAAGVAVSGYPSVVSTSSQAHTVTATLTASPATRYRWRVKTADAVSGYGPFSDWQYFYVTVAASVSILTPATGFDLLSPVFDVTWGAPSGGSGVQQDARIRITHSVTGALVHDSGVIGGTGTTYTVPITAGLQRGESYVVTLTVHDTINQEAEDTISVDAAWLPPEPIHGLRATPLGGS